MTTSPDTVRLVHAEELCVAGFLSKTAPPRALIDNVRSVAAGDRGLQRHGFDGMAGRLVRPRRQDADVVVPPKAEFTIAEAVVRCYQASLN
jgi:DNA-binding NarL/FixJ family response regulator